MADIKTGEPFGLDHAVLKKIDWALALKRIRQDLRSDFILCAAFKFSLPKGGGRAYRQPDQRTEFGDV